MTTTLPRLAGAERPALSAHQLTALRAMLEEQRAFRTEQLAELQLVPATPVSPANQEIVVSLIFGARAALFDVEGALQRMDDGTYGSCVDCGDQLDEHRLEILPQAALCMPCQRSAHPR